MRISDRLFIEMSILQVIGMANAVFAVQTLNTYGTFWALSQFSIITMSLILYAVFRMEKFEDERKERKLVRKWITSK